MHSHAHTSHKCKSIIYANEVATGLIHIATNTISCTVLHQVQRQRNERMSMKILAGRISLFTTATDKAHSCIQTLSHSGFYFLHMPILSLILSNLFFSKSRFRSVETNVLNSEAVC